MKKKISPFSSEMLRNLSRKVIGIYFSSISKISPNQIEFRNFSKTADRVQHIFIYYYYYLKKTKKEVKGGGGRGGHVPLALCWLRGWSSNGRALAFPRLAPSYSLLYSTFYFLSFSTSSENNFSCPPTAPRLLLSLLGACGCQRFRGGAEFFLGVII